jgi:serine/threonine-protein kinase
VIDNQAGTLVADRYRIIEKIGEGGMQLVFRVHDETLNRDVALKVPKNSTADKRFYRSAVVAAKVNHPNVAKTLDYYEDVEENACLIEEFIDGEDLEKALLNKTDYVDPYMTSKIFHYLSKGIAASHHVGVIHRDLKPTNVMLTGGFAVETLKITDFGIAKMAEGELVGVVEKGTDSITASQTVVGALPYMSPEAINTPKDVTTKTDIWSIGAMMYQLLTGSLPFGSGLSAINKITNHEPAEIPSFVLAKPQYRPLCEQIINIISKCLTKDPDLRPDADELSYMCSQLCYPMTDRFHGYVGYIVPPHKAFGFIRSGGEQFFYHRDSVYGSSISVDDLVMFSTFPSQPQDRAHPVIKLKQ